MRAYIEQYMRNLRSVTDIPTRTFWFFAATQIPLGKQLLFLTHILAINIRIWIAFRKSQCCVCIKNVMNAPSRTFCFVAATQTPQAGIHLERAFASMPRPTVKRHTLFCHACPSPALFSIVCAVVINNKYTSLTEDWQTCAPPLSIFRICYGVQP